MAFLMGSTLFWFPLSLSLFQGEYAEAEPLYGQCQAIEEKFLGPEHPDLAITLNSRAQMLESQVGVDWRASHYRAVYSFEW